MTPDELAALQTTAAEAWEAIEGERSARVYGDSLFGPDQIRGAWHNVGFALIKGIDRSEFEGLSPSVASNAKWLCMHHEQLNELGVFDRTTATHPTRIRQAFNRIKDRMVAAEYPLEKHFAALQDFSDIVPDLPLEAFGPLMKVVAALQGQLMATHVAKLKAAGVDTSELEATLAEYESV